MVMSNTTLSRSVTPSRGGIGSIVRPAGGGRGGGAGRPIIPGQGGLGGVKPSPAPQVAPGMTFPGQTPPMFDRGDMSPEAAAWRNSQSDLYQQWASTQPTHQAMSVPGQVVTAQPAQQPAQQPAGMNPGTGGIYAHAGQQNNPLAIFQNLLNGLLGGGGQGQAGAGQANVQRPAATNPWAILGTGAMQTSNPVAPGSAQGAANSPAQAAALGNWQNAMNMTHLTGYRGPQMATSDYSHDLSGQQWRFDTPQNALNRAFAQLGTGAVQTTNPVAPGSAHGAANSPAQAAAIGNWQNAMALQHLSGGYLGPDKALTDYGYNDEGKWVLGGRYASPPQRPAAGGGGGTGGGGGAGGGGHPVVGDGQGIAPIYSTVDGQREIFNNAQTQRNINQQVEQIRTAGDMRSGMKRTARPGMSLDAGSAAQAAPRSGQALADALAVQASGGLVDQLANRNYQLSGQEAAGQETLQMAELLRRLQQAGDYEQSAYANSIYPALIQLLMG